jgi:hypothetical protein
MRAIKLCITTILSAIGLIGISGQTLENTKEQYRIITDRSAYITGEKIRFRIFNDARNKLKEIDWSKIYYLELISPEGSSKARVKLPLDSSGSSGSIQIPEHISSGSYYLKGYTRWMRNDGPAAYTYLSVEIVNPDISTVLPVDTSASYTISFEGQVQAQNTNVSIASELNGELKFRSPAELKISSANSNKKIDCCVSVVPMESILGQSEYYTGSVRIHRRAFDQLPETRGISLAGKVAYLESEKPASFALVYVSSIGIEKEFYCNYTDSAGRFHFAFPEQVGDQDFFISADHRLTDQLKVSIDQDFCTEPIALPSFPLRVDQKRLDLFAEMADNLKIRSMYFPAASKSEEMDSLSNRFFYNQPVSVVEFSDFIRLPTMREYFSEVVPQVSVRKSDKRMRLRVQGGHPDLSIYDPLVMIDGIAIADIESLLAVSPRLVARIEIVDAPYIRGNVTFGGIINVVSRKGDLAMIDLPESGLLLHYQMFDPKNSNIPDFCSEDDHLPDVRNTLFWNPQLELTPGTDTVITFHTSDSYGEYVVLVRGFDSQGSYFEQGIPFILE